MSFYNELSDLFPCLPFRRYHYSHRLYEGYVYDDSVRGFLSSGHGHHVTSYIFAAQINMPWLKRHKKQIWSLIPLSSGSAVLKCKSRAGEVLHYSYIEGVSCWQATRSEFVLDKYRLSVMRRPVRALDKVSLGVSKAINSCCRKAIQVSEKQPKFCRT